MPAQTQILTRRGAAATWTSTNPTLGAGEIGYETDTGKFKIGTGAATWTSLGYFNQDPVTTKGDLYTFSTTDARLAVGNNGETLVADSAATTGLSWQGNYAAGKNKVINGDFNVNQRSFTTTTTSNTFGFDRWLFGTLDGTVTYTAETFTPGSAPVAGYEGTNFAQIAVTGQTLTTAQSQLIQRIESARTFAGQTLTFSFWAKANTGTPNVNVQLTQSFGTGGSPSANVVTNGTNQAITTSWARYSFTIAIPSISGKTFGTAGNDYLQCGIFVSGGSTSNLPTVGIQNNTFQIWGVQVEESSIASPFQTATGTKQGELAACQRYYSRLTNTSSINAQLGLCVFYSTTAAKCQINLPVSLRIPPSSLDYASVQLIDTSVATFAPSSLALAASTSSTIGFDATVTGATQHRAGWFRLTATTGFIALNAEL
jgi:hypothetical protein